MWKGSGLRAAAAGLALALCLPACRNKVAGELRPPEGAGAWDSRLGQLFDDRCTLAPVQLAGRAPGDVLDQRRFIQRLGYANLIVLVTVDQVWSRTLLGGVPQQRAEVTLGRVLRGKLPKRVAPQQTLVFREAEELPMDAVGRVMLLFVRWAPGEAPAYHHHLMVAADEALALIEAMVQHAKEAGKLGDETPRKRRRRKDGD